MPRPSTKGREGYRWRMLPPARDPVTPKWLARAALSAGDHHLALVGLRNRLRSRYDAPVAFLTAGGTDALILAFRTAFRSRGERTLALPAFGCYSLVSAAVAAEARLFFYDVDPLTLSPDEESLRSVLEQGAGTVVVAHFYGYPAAMERVLALTRVHDALVVEDAAQAGGGTLHGAPLGSFGDLTVFSYGRGKGTTAGAGGALLVRDERLVEHFRHEVREVLGSDGPGRTSGWRELAVAGAQWAVGRPWLFRIPYSIPALGLGETRYPAPRDPAPMAVRAALLLDQTLGPGMGEAVLARQRRAHELRTRLDKLGARGVDLIRPAPGAVPGALRCPLLLPEGSAERGGEPSLGILPSYPRLLPELEAARAMALAGSDPMFPGAEQLRRRLHTAPTHAWVRERDLDAMVRWVEGQAEPEAQSRTEPRPDSWTEARPASWTDARPHSWTEARADSWTESRPDTWAEPQTALHQTQAEPMQTPPPFPLQPAEPTIQRPPPAPEASSESDDSQPGDLLDFWLPSGGDGRWARPSRSRGNGSLPWDLLMAAVVVFVLTSVARIHLLFPVLKPFHPTQVAALSAIFLFAINYHPARRLVTIGSPVSTLLLVLLGWMAMAVPFALREHGSFMFLVNDFGKTALLFFLIVGSVRAIRDVERLAYAYFLGAALYAGVVLVRFSLGDSWRLGNLITYDANDFALFAVTAVPIGVYFLGEAGGSIVRRVGTGLGLAAVGVAFVQSGSRGGFLALLTVLVFMLLRHRAIPFKWRVGGLGLLVLTLFTAASGTYWDQMSTLLAPSSDYNLTAETGRLQIWQRGMGYLWKKPLFGVGPSNFPVAEGVLSPLADRQELGIGVPWTSPHNAFVQVAVELGVPGFLIYLMFLASVFVLLRRMSKVREERPWEGASLSVRGDRPGLAQALMGSFLGFVVGAFFLSLAYSAMLLTLAGLAGALWKTTRVGPDKRRGDRPVHPTRLKRSGPEAARFLTGAIDGQT